MKNCNSMTGFILAPPQSWEPPDIKLVIRSGGQLLIRWHRIGKNDRSWSLHIGDTWIGGASVPCWQMRIEMYVEMHARICAYTHPWIACPVLTDGYWMRVNNAYVAKLCKCRWTWSCRSWPMCEANCCQHRGDTVCNCRHSSQLWTQCPQEIKCKKEH